MSANCCRFREFIWAYIFCNENVRYLGTGSENDPIQLLVLTGILNRWIRWKTGPLSSNQTFCYIYCFDGTFCDTIPYRNKYLISINFYHMWPHFILYHVSGFTHTSVVICQVRMLTVAWLSCDFLAPDIIGRITMVSDVSLGAAHTTTAPGADCTLLS